MKRFYAFLLALPFLFAASMPATAGMDLSQQDDGTADWVNNNTGDRNQITERILNVILEDVSTASTTYVVIPWTNAKVSFIQTVVQGAITAASANLNFHHLTSDGVYVEEVSRANNGANALTITWTDGAYTSVGVTSDVDTFTPDNGNQFEQSDVIAIATDGASTNDIDVHLTITLEKAR